MEEEELVASYLMEHLGCSEALTLEYIQIALADIQLFDWKQHDYGPENIAAFGEFGVVVRMNDKMARIRKLTVAQESPNNESLADSYADMSVYGVIARMCRAGVWPGVKPADAPKLGATPVHIRKWSYMCPHCSNVWQNETPATRPQLCPACGEDIWVIGKPRPTILSTADVDGNSGSIAVSSPFEYWCPRCQKNSPVRFGEDGNTHCAICSTFLYGPGLGGYR